MAQRTYQQVEMDYLATAPFHGQLRQVLPASAEAVFAVLEDADAWPVWLNPVDEVIWRTDPPFGVGTTRTIRIGKVSIEEYFFAWEPGRRMSFRFASGSLPFRAFAEDWLLEPRGEHECELVWSYAFGLRGPLGLVNAIVGRRFTADGVRSLQQLADFIANR